MKTALLFIVVFFASFAVWAAPESLQLQGLVELQESSFQLGFQLKKTKENRRRVTYKGTVDVESKGVVRRRRAKVVFLVKKRKATSEIFIQGNGYEGETLFLSTDTKGFNFGSGEKLAFDVQHMEYVTVTGPVDTYTFWRTLDEGRGELTVK